MSRYIKQFEVVGEGSLDRSGHEGEGIEQFDQQGAEHVGESKKVNLRRTQVLTSAFVVCMCLMHNADDVVNSN